MGDPRVLRRRFSSRRMFLLAVAALVAAAWIPAPAGADALRYIKVALAGERAALKGVVGRLGRVDVSAAKGRALPISGTADLGHLSDEDADVVGLLSQGGDRAQIAAAPFSSARGLFSGLDAALRSRKGAETA